jgi:hypothetical protein
MPRGMTWHYEVVGGIVMKKKLGIISLLSCLTAFLGCSTTMQTTTTSGEVTRTALFAQYDRIRGSTEVQSLVFIRVPMLGPSVEMWMHAFHRDTALVAPLKDVVLVFKSASGTQTSGWQFLKNNDLHVLLNDSERLRFEGAHEGDVGPILLKEVIAFRIPTSELMRIGQASKVEGLLGNWRFDLKPEEITKVREMALFASKDPNAPLPIRGRAK